MMKVVIADDSVPVRERLAAMLSELEDVELVGQASSLAEVLWVVQQTRPDVVILDVRMPGGNGIEALKMIKATGAAPVVIMLTAFPYPQYRKKCLEAGADYFFDKATEFDRIPGVLEQWPGLPGVLPASPVQSP